MDWEALALTGIGKIPLVGDVIKDQLAAKASSLASKRQDAAINRLSSRIKQIGKKELSDKQKSDLAEFVLDYIDRSMRQRHGEKIDIFAEVVAEGFRDPDGIDKLETLLVAFERMSIDGVRLLALLAKSDPRARQQLHAFSGVMDEVERKFGYDYLIMLLRELEACGCLDLEMQQSSIHQGRARFTVFWRELGTEIASFVDGQTQQDDPEGTPQRGAPDL